LNTPRHFGKMDTANKSHSSPPRIGWTDPNWVKVNCVNAKATTASLMVALLVALSMTPTTSAESPNETAWVIVGGLQASPAEAPAPAPSWAAQWFWAEASPIAEPTSAATTCILLVCADASASAWVSYCYPPPPLAAYPCWSANANGMVSGTL
jgi:hypothetical protein